MLKRIRDLFGGRRNKVATSEPTVAPPVAPPVHRGPNVVHRPISRADLDPDAVKIIERLTRFDHSAYLVGGCVRDLLLDRKPKDFDIGTAATPRQIKRVFRNCRIIGRRFRLAHIYFQNGKIIEVATFRSTNGDFGRRGDETVENEDLMIRDDNVFGTPEEDALRRDFTINSLFYDLNNETVLDHTDGLGDLRRRLVRTIGPPATRFSEDPIRILRAVKFAARLDFEIEGETEKALRAGAREIPKAAAPRILEEIARFGREGCARRSFELLRRHGIFEVVLPEFVRGYRDNAAWDLLLALLDGMDRQRAQGHEVTPAEIFAALLLPVLAHELGWRRDGTAHPARGLDLRAVVDDALRPVALRLRVSRRDQESCRQIIAMLARMVPATHVRRSLRRTIERRSDFQRALWMLGAAAGHLGGDFAAAFESWKRSTGEAPRREAEAPRPSEEPGGERRRRRGRRGRRRTGHDDQAEPLHDGGPSDRERRPAAGRGTEPEGRRRSKEIPAAAEGKSAQPPRRWDDDYFFAALPSAPDDDIEESGDRYGAGAVAAVVDGGLRDEAGAGADGARAVAARAPERESGSGGRRRRRRGSRRRKRGGDPDGGAADADRVAVAGESAGEAVFDEDDD